MDVSFLSQVNANALKQVSVKPVSDGGFSAALESAEQHVSPELVTPELLKTFLEDPNSTLPEGIRKSLLALFSDTVFSPKELSVLGKQLSIYASGLAEVVTFSSNPLDVTQADFNLQIVTAGMMTMVDAYGNQHALNDLIGLWKKLDTRTASFENLESNFIEFSKKGTMDLSARPDLVTPEEKQQLTFDMQYAMWTKISSYGHLERSKVLLAAFEESQQMRTAKIEFTGEPLDSLVDDPLEGLITA